MVKEIGCYNVSDCGMSYESNIIYNMIIFEKFDRNNNVTEKKTIYFKCGKDLFVPDFKYESEIEEFLLTVKNNEKVKSYKKIVFENIK